MFKRKTDTERELKTTLKWKHSTHVDAQPISGFSQRSLVSNSIFHFLVLFTPDCMLLRAGTKILTFRVLMCSSGTPVRVVMSYRKTSKGVSNSHRHPDAAFCTQAPLLRFTCKLSFVKSFLAYFTTLLFYNKTAVFICKMYTGVGRGVRVQWKKVHKNF